MSPLNPLARLPWKALVTVVFPLGALPAAAQQTPVPPGKVADAGPDRFQAPPAPLVLAGRVQGPKSLRPDAPATVSWTKVSGPPLSIVGGDTLAPTVIPSQIGTYTLRLEVSGVAGSNDSDDMVLRVFGAGQGVTVSGEPRVWHKLALTFTHTVTLAESSFPNPFLDLRLVVDFLHPSGAVYSVPGFFAADGNAAQTGAAAGNRWRVNFVPDRPGPWYYSVSFRSGSQVALSLDPLAGSPASFDGASGSIEVERADPNAPGFLAKGRLEYVNRHYLRFAENHEYFLKSGAGSPENFLAYYEFDSTFDTGGAPDDLDLLGAMDGVHHYDPHLGDYVDLGVPLWNGKGERIFGAINYLASRGVNSLYALTYNIDGGDGREVWPWSPATDKLRFDVSKLSQWERVLDHMTNAGIVWHLFTQETENDAVLDFGSLGTQRKLYYRELVARFAHGLGLVWNLGEENDNLPADRVAFADYIRALDPYDHPIALHNIPGNLDASYGALYGNHLELATLMSEFFRLPGDVVQLIDASQSAGRPWTVNLSELGPPEDGAVPDSVDFWHDVLRREVLWPTLFAQGGGCEWYFGYDHPHNDLDCEDFRSRENLWLLTKRALDFLREHVPFEDMQHAEELAIANGPSVLAKPGEFYLVYLPSGGTLSLDFETHPGVFLVSWFDARNGGPLVNGSVTQVGGNGVRSLGSPPGPGDWVAFVRRATNLPPVLESFTIAPDPFRAGEDFSIQVHARDPNGPSDELTVKVRLDGPNGEFNFVTLAHRGGTLYSFFVADAPLVSVGTWEAEVTVRDEGDLEVTSAKAFEAE